MIGAEALGELKDSAASLVTLTELLMHTEADAVLMRGTEGEPVSDPRRAPRLDVFIGGRARGDLSRAAVDGVLTELPVLPRSHDAATTAVYIQSVVSGEKPAPGPLAQQVDCLLHALAAIGQDSAPRERTA